MNVSELIYELQQADPLAEVQLLVRDNDHDWIRFDEHVRTSNQGNVFEIISVDGALDTEDGEDD